MTLFFNFYFYLVCSWVLPRHGRDLAIVLSHFEPGGRDIQGRRVLEMTLIRKVAVQGLCLWLSVSFCCHLCLEELRTGVPAVLSELNLYKMAMAIGAQVDLRFLGSRCPKDLTF